VHLQVLQQVVRLPAAASVRRLNATTGGDIIYVPFRSIPNDDGSEVMPMPFRPPGMSTEKFTRLG
jgi:hypothetical protein